MRTSRKTLLPLSLDAYTLNVPSNHALERFVTGSSERASFGPLTADVRRHSMHAAKLFVLVPLILSATSVAFGQDEYFVHHGADARTLSKKLQANAHESQFRFDNSADISNLPAWLIGSCHTAADEFHLIAYYSTPELAYVGVFNGSKQLRALWKFPFDARQFYTEGTRLMFTERPMLHMDTADSWAAVAREVVVDFAALPASGTFAFQMATYTVPK